MEDSRVSQKDRDQALSITQCITLKCLFSTRSIHINETY